MRETASGNIVSLDASGVRRHRGDRDHRAGDKTRKCLDDQQRQRYPGTKVQMWECDGPTGRAEWTVNKKRHLTTPRLHGHQPGVTNPTTAP